MKLQGLGFRWGFNAVVVHYWVELQGLGLGACCLKRLRSSCKRLVNLLRKSVTFIPKRYIALHVYKEWDIQNKSQVVRNMQHTLENNNARSSDVCRNFSQCFRHLVFWRDVFDIRG